MKGTFTRTHRVKVPFMRIGMEVGFPSCELAEMDGVAQLYATSESGCGGPYTGQVLAS
jgi:hypothetical protein